MIEDFYFRLKTSIRSNTLVYLFFSVFLLEFIWLAISPNSREDWLLENVLVLFFFSLVLLNFKKYTFSTLSWCLILSFLFIHEIGAHYTYSEVPYDEFFNSAFGFKLNHFMGWERNHFDRLAHFAYGLLLVLPLQQICSQVSGSTSGWTYFVAVNLVMSTSLLYELIEWGAASLFGGELGIAYLGTQGDVWDAHQDMLLSIIGALLALLIKSALIKFYQFR